ncbi:FkbM family methyltransferase [Mycobacterium lehmannii]|uniref:FkbM family methyltransferase n=1 Tax=Mycobacterium lehmannii TaxID=2048550 RepID=A0A101A730_9MYCO|nr:FkbM family methyltransferase [Mycobacterium lehmannii]KUI15630.1 FkbM family methyltransferase [Mycobacterium lehmannii]
MELWDRARFLARGAAVELSRSYSERQWKRQFAEQLISQEVNVVFDVGANSGQYAIGLRKAGYKGRIVSFEPLSSPFSVLEERASGDRLWECRKWALGDTDGTITINVAGNAAQSSSALPMLQRHQDAYPPANYVGMEEAPIRRLDTIAPELMHGAENAFLKIDVQGFEKHVLAGGKSMINDRCVGMQLELSFVPLYEGAMLIPETLDLVYSAGFKLMGLLPCFVDPRNGQMLQADGIFFREWN